MRVMRAIAAGIGILLVLGAGIPLLGSLLVYIAASTGKSPSIIRGGQPIDPSNSHGGIGLEAIAPEDKSSYAERYAAPPPGEVSGYYSPRSFSPGRGNYSGSSFRSRRSSGRTSRRSFGGTTTVRSHYRRTPSGRMTRVRSHTRRIR